MTVLEDASMFKTGSQIKPISSNEEHPFDATIIVERSFFYNEPYMDAKGSSYVQSGDNVKVLGTQENDSEIWALSEFTSKEGKTTAGYLLVSTLQRKPG